MELPDISHLRIEQNPALVSLFRKYRASYMLQELMAIREDVIGSQALIRFVDRGCAIESLDEALCDKDRPFGSACIVINAYVSQVALGAAALKHKGLPVPPSPVAAGSNLAELKRTKVDYKPLWEHVDSERSSGSLKHDATWQDGWLQGRGWRDRLEKVLAALHDRFISQVAVPVLDFSQADVILTNAITSDMDKALATVKPLPEALASAAPTASARGLLEALRVLGESVETHLARAAREEGNELVKKAAKAGPHQDRLRIVAAQRYAHAATVPSETGVAYCNAAAVDLMLKNFKSAQQMAHAAVAGNGRRDREPLTLHAKRAACIKALRSGYFPNLPPSLVPQKSSAQKKADELIAWKCIVRLATAHAGVCRERMKESRGSGSQEAQYEYSDAEKRFKEAYKMRPDDPTPMKELQKLNAEFEAYHQRWSMG